MSQKNVVSPGYNFRYLPTWSDLYVPSRELEKNSTITVQIAMKLNYSYLWYPGDNFSLIWWHHELSCSYKNRSKRPLFHRKYFLKIWMMDFTGFFHMMNPDHVAQSLSVALVLKWLYTQDINNTWPYLHEICRDYSRLPVMYHMGTVSVRIQLIKEPTAFITQVPLWCAVCKFPP